MNVKPSTYTNKCGLHWLTNPSISAALSPVKTIKCNQIIKMKDAAQSSTSLWIEPIKSTTPGLNLVHYSFILGFQHRLHTCRDQTSSQLPEGGSSGEEHNRSTRRVVHHGFLPQVRLLAQRSTLTSWSIWRTWPRACTENRIYSPFW